MTAGDTRKTSAPARPLGDFRWWLAGLLTTGRLPALLLAVGAAILLYGFLATDDYDVRHVVVYGSDYTDAGDVARRADLLGGSIFRLDPGLAAERVATDPAIARVEVELEFPARARVNVIERSPVLVWQAGDQSVLVDATGIVIGSDDGRDLPQVRAEEALPRVGERLPADVVQAASDIGSVMGEASILVTEQEMIEVTLDGGRRILFGFPDRIDEKLQVLRTLLPEIGGEWSELDLSQPDRPAYR